MQVARPGLAPRGQEGVERRDLPGSRVHHLEDRRRLDHRRAQERIRSLLLRGQRSPRGLNVPHGGHTRLRALAARRRLGGVLRGVRLAAGRTGRLLGQRLVRGPGCPTHQHETGLQASISQDRLNPHGPYPVEAHRPGRRRRSQGIDVTAAAGRHEHVEDLVGRPRRFVDGLVFAVDLDARKALADDREFGHVGPGELLQHLEQRLHGSGLYISTPARPSPCPPNYSACASTTRSPLGPPAPFAPPGDPGDPNTRSASPRS